MIESELTNYYGNDEEEIRLVEHNQWIEDGVDYYPTYPTKKFLPSGFYEPRSGNRGYYFVKKNTTSDELFQLPSPELSTVLKDLENFWSKADKFKEYGLLHKRGVLLYGIQGAGKSGIIRLCTNYVVNTMKGIVINITDGRTAEIYQGLVPALRTIEPDRPLIVILEDIDALTTEGSWSTSMLLNILDGVNQINNVVYIATTNYPEKLPANIVKRPSRFDLRLEVKLPNEEVREAYLKAKLTKEDLENINMQEWITSTEGMSLAHLRELIASVIVLGNSFAKVIIRLKNMETNPTLRNKLAV